MCEIVFFLVHGSWSPECVLSNTGIWQPPAGASPIGEKLFLVLLIWQPLVACDVLVDSDVGLLVQLVLLVGETITSTTNISSIHYTTLAQLNY